MTPREKQLKLIRERVIYSNPAIKERIGIVQGKRGGISYQTHTPEIGLADVLLAIEYSGVIRGGVGQKKEIKVFPGETLQRAKQRAYSDSKDWVDEAVLSEPCKKIIIGWNLRKNLDDQSNTLIDLLSHLLK